MKFRSNLCLLLPLFSCISFSALSQGSVVPATPVDGMVNTAVSSQFREFSTYHIDSRKLVALVRSDAFSNRVTLDLPGHGRFEIDLFENRLIHENYILTIASDNGIEHRPWDGIVKAFRGNLQGGQYVVSLTIDEGFIFGFIQLSAKDELRIEPLHLHMHGAPDDIYIVYKASDAIDTHPRGCQTMMHTLRKHDPEAAPTQQLRADGDCREVEIAFANDWLMYTDHGNSVTNVENHNIGVMNDSQNNYDNEFADDLIFVIVQIWVSTCSSCDPWSGTTDSGQLLGEFRSWGQSGGFSVTYDVADLWTDREFNGPTVGVSWLDAVCTSFRYLTTQDFTGNGNLLRCLLSHELGHNFGSGHDPEGSPTIMAPTVQNTNTWSSSSINQINNYIDDINCLSLCATAQAPIANFSADETEGCASFVVHFSDESSGPPTSWEWTFPGGSPSSSTQQNPTVTYQTPGTYDVILEVSNSVGSNTLVKTDYITVLALPVAEFAYSQNGLTLQFTSLSQNADSWFWDFGDGFTSNQENPFHTYNQDGEYEISLTVSNACGEDTYTIFAEVYVAPEAGFSYSTDFGCAPLVVQFINESSDNVQSFEWYFPGGTPSFSTQENPVVTYPNPGFYDVTLIVENIAGLDELSIQNLIEVAPLPEADFNFAVNGLSVQFINASVDANNYLWIFGDGNTSTSHSPNHEYEAGGTYQVMLISSNDCGSDTAFATVSLNAAPVADFTVSVSEGCVPLTVIFTSTSQGEVTSYNWSFPGGSPSASTAMMPVVTYQNPGTYSAQLIVGNAIGFDTLFLQDVVTVYAEVNSGFSYSTLGTLVNFTNTSSGADTYQWLVDGNVFGSMHLSYDFEEDGDYLVQLIATGECGSDTSTQLIHIATPPVAGIASGETSGCQPFTVQFYNNSSLNATQFEWIFEGGMPAMSNEEDPVVVYNEPGTFNVQLTVWSEGGMDVLVINDMIEVFPLPTAQFETHQTGLEITFNNISLNADSYQWFFGDGGTSTETHPKHVYAAFGTYPVMLISRNSCGADTMVLNLELSASPVPNFTASFTHGCVPLEIQFTDMSQNGPEQWSWSFPGGNPSSSMLQNPVVVYDQPGIYSVSLVVTNSGGMQSLVRDEYIFVAYPPVADFHSQVTENVVKFENLSAGGETYLWVFGDGAVDTAAHPVHTYGANGTYPVQLIVTNACASDTVIYDVTIMVTATEDPQPGQNIVLYPNPNLGTFTLHVSGLHERTSLDVYDAFGRVILSEMLTPDGSDAHEISLENPTAGVYLVLLHNEAFRRALKMIVVDAVR